MKLHFYKISIFFKKIRSYGSRKRNTYLKAFIFQPLILGLCADMRRNVFSKIHTSMCGACEIVHATSFCLASYVYLIFPSSPTQLPSKSIYSFFIVFATIESLVMISAVITHLSMTEVKVTKSDNKKIMNR